ncbi:MAG: dipeptidase [Pseudomonadota bacterium]
MEPTLLSRREALIGSAATVLVGASGKAGTLQSGLNQDQLKAGIALLKKYPSVDIHAHPGRFFARGFSGASRIVKALPAPDEAAAASDLNSGMVSAALFAGVADMALLDANAGGGLYAAREFAAGEALADYERQLTALQHLSADPRLARGKSVRDIARARRACRTACVFAVEGGDFIEDRLERIAAAHAAGVRSITMVHYHVNAFGDIQTAPAVHGGLTVLGRAAVKAMNKSGVLIDVAHATFETTRGVVDASSRPVMLSHSNLQSATAPNPRLVTPEHARLVAGTGGLIGSIPWGINQATLSDWIDSLLRLVDAVGIDHVGIGTDMDANFRPVFKSYRDWPLIPAMLLARGLHEREVAAVIGGNFLRVFAHAT